VISTFTPPAHTAGMRPGTSSGRTTPGAHVVEIWAEQERKNAELPEIDDSHIPSLRVDAGYVAGRSRAPRRRQLDGN
jgi:hypothetical protein